MRPFNMGKQARNWLFGADSALGMFLIPNFPFHLCEVKEVCKTTMVILTIANNIYSALPMCQALLKMLHLN